MDLPRVLVTRAAEDARTLSHALGIAGFEPVEVPLLKRLWQVEAVAAAARDAGDIDVVLVTSSTGAEVLAAAAPTAWPAARVAAVGPTTARRLHELGLPVDVVPRVHTGADLVDALGDVEGVRIFYPRADVAVPTTAQGLRQAGADVIDVVAYVNAAPKGCADRLRRVLPLDAVTLMSGSAARRLADAVPAEDRPLLGRVVVIGPTTAAATREAGLPVDAIANPHSVGGMVEAVRRVLA